MGSVIVGQKVTVLGERGVVRFVGNTQFASGQWIGVELDSTLGKNNGSVNGIEYFKLLKQDGLYGIFVRPDLVVLLDQGDSHKRESEIERMSKIVAALQAKVKKMKEDIEIATSKLVKVEDEKNQLRQSLERTEELLEHKTIDNELLEEQQLELQEKIQSLQSEFQKINHSSDQHPNTEDLDARIRELSLALVTLQEHSSQTEMDLENQLEHLKSTVLNYKELEKRLQIAETKLSDSEILISELNEQLSFTSEKDVSKIVILNKELTAQVKLLQEDVSQLEELHALNEEVLNNQAFLEKEYQEEISTLKQQTLTDRERIAELEKQAQTFRQNSSNLKIANDTHIKYQLSLKQIFSLELSKETKSIEIDNLKEFVKVLKNSREFSSDSITYLESKIKLNSSMEMLALMIQKLYSQNDSHFQNFLILTRVSEALCSAQFVSNMMKFNMPLHMNEFGSLVDKLESSISKFLDNFAALNDVHIQISGLEDASNKLMKTDWEFNYFLRREKTLYLLSSRKMTFSSPVLWILNFMIESLVSAESLEAAKLSKLLKEIYSIVSKFDKLLESKIDSLNQLTRDSKEIEETNFIDLKDTSRSFHRLINLYDQEHNTLSNDDGDNGEEFFQDVFLELSKLDSSRLIVAVDQIEDLHIQGEFLELEEISEKLAKTFTPNLASKEQIDQLRNELHKLTSSIKEKESDLQELNLKISFLKRKLNEKDIESTKFAQQAIKIKELSDENEELEKQLVLLKEDLKSNLARIEEFNRRGNTFGGDFDNIYEEKEFTEKAALIGEIHSLRRTLQSRFVQKSVVADTEDWLVENRSSKEPLNNFKNVKSVYKKLMLITTEYSIIPISSTKHSALIGEYYCSMLQNEISDYERMKSGLF